MAATAASLDFVLVLHQKYCLVPILIGYFCPDGDEVTPIRR